MDILEIIVGVVLILVAIGAMIAVIVTNSIIPAGIAAVALAAGIYLEFLGIHGEHAKFHSKHEAILRDLTSEGFKVRYRDVYAVGGNYLFGTEVDIPAGSCLFAFEATKIEGKWYATLPQSGRGGAAKGVTILKPSAIPRLAQACP